MVEVAGRGGVGAAGEAAGVVAPGGVAAQAVGDLVGVNVVAIREVDHGTHGDVGGLLQPLPDLSRRDWPAVAAPDRVLTGEGFGGDVDDDLRLPAHGRGDEFAGALIDRGQVELEVVARHVAE
ncbi:hypothetical protein [Aeromicrobium sp.]|uniref:hypothetical protein n=1 Tax=Aeromicrobium sp. TaxID=1871063 RepID=UPI0035176677